MRKPPIVLVIDDDTAFRKQTVTWLENAGYAATGACGREALKRFHELRPEVVVTEIVMRDQEGLELIAQLRQMDSGLFIVAVTGGLRALSYLKMAQRFGATAALQKPVVAEELLQILGCPATSYNGDPR